MLGTTDAWKAFYPSKRPVLAELLVDRMAEKVPDWYSGKFARSQFVDEAFEAIDFFPHTGRPGVWLYFTAATILDENGQIIGAVETLEDITGLKEKEVAVTESKNFLDKIINTIGDPIFVKDQDHRWVLMNDAMCRFMGYPREMLIGKSDYDFFPQKEADIFWQKDEIVFSGTNENLNEERITDADGRTHTIVTKKTLYADAAGHPFIVRVIRDITDRKLSEQELRESEEMFRSLVEFSPFGVLLTSPDGTVLSANAAACRLLGRTDDEIRQLGRTGIVDTSDPRMAAALEEREKTGTATARVMTFFRKDGSRFEGEVSSTIFLTRNGQRLTSMIFSKVTGRKNAEEGFIKNPE